MNATNKWVLIKEIHETTLKSDILQIIEAKPKITKGKVIVSDPSITEFTKDDTILVDRSALIPTKLNGVSYSLVKLKDVIAVI